LEGGRSRIVGVGLAVVDIFSSVDEEFLRSLAFDKGTSNPVSYMMFARVLRSLRNPRVEPGGQIANTIRLLSQLGHDCTFVTRVNPSTEAGAFFIDSLENLGVEVVQPTGQSLRDPLHCILLITPDGESTQISLLPDITAMALDDVKLLPSASLIYLDGFLLNNVVSSHVLFAAVERAMSLGIEHIAFNLSNITWVQEFFDEFQEIVARAVTLLIGTEEEVRGIFSPDFAVTSEELWQIILNSPWAPKLVVATRGEKGVIGIQEGKIVECPAVPVRNVVDTTGGGDALAAGLFHGVLKGWDLYESLRLGTQMASWVIGEVGAVPHSAYGFLSEIKESLD
jgi:sugar/nucleoside kinase (ribokinase family)